MWTYAKPTKNPLWGINNRAHGWSIDQRERGYDVIGHAIGLTVCGWVVYELWGHSGHEYRMTLVDDNGNYVADYPLTDDEFWSHPELPRNWAIPF